MGRYGKVGPSGMKGYSKHRAALLPCFSGNCFPSKFTVVIFKILFHISGVKGEMGDPGPQGPDGEPGEITCHWSHKCHIWWDLSWNNDREAVVWLQQVSPVSAPPSGTWLERWTSWWPSCHLNWSSLKMVWSHDSYFFFSLSLAVNICRDTILLHFTPNAPRSANTGHVNVKFLEIQVLIFQHCPPLQLLLALKRQRVKSICWWRRRNATLMLSSTVRRGEGTWPCPRTREPTPPSPAT